MSKEFVTLSKTGINVIALGSVSTRKIKDNLGFDKQLHGLDSLSYLKVDAGNYINCKCQIYENRVISIEQESQIKKAGEVSTIYEEIYKIKIHEVTLRELLIL